MRPTQRRGARRGGRTARWSTSQRKTPRSPTPCPLTSNLQPRRAGRAATPDGTPGLALCDCGQERARGYDACPQCLWADGRTHAQEEVVAALRVLGPGASIHALTPETALCERQVYRGLAQLLQSGRVTKLVLADGPAVGARVGYALHERRRRGLRLSAPAPRRARRAA